MSVLLAENHRIGSTIGYSNHCTIGRPGNIRFGEHGLVPAVVAQTPDVTVAVGVGIAVRSKIVRGAKRLNDLGGRAVRSIGSGRIETNLFCHIVDVSLFDERQKHEVDRGMFSRTWEGVFPVGEVPIDIVKVV